LTWKVFTSWCRIQHNDVNTDQFEPLNTTGETCAHERLDWLDIFLEN
jgi:hypothetical protein